MLLFTVGIYAQGINYKALIKDGGGNVVASQMVTVQFQILQGGAMDNVYQETHTPMTDANGIIIISIGEGTRDSGVFANIDWGADDHFLNTQIDTGAGLIDMGTSGFKTVPYALYAKTAGNLPDGINESNYLRWDATNSAWVVGDSKIAIGHEAGQTNQGISAVATGFRAGQTNQGLQSVATGAFAGSETQGEYSVAIGFAAGQTTQGTNSIATGNGAGQTNQGSSAVAIGHAAGFMNQGTNSIAIGHEAGWLDQHFNSIVLNATGVTLNTASTNAFYVAPIRSENTSLQLYYNTGTNEVTYGNSTPISTVMTDAELRSVTTTWTQGPSFNTITGFKASSLVKISYIIPSRNDFSGWGGLFIEPQISFDDGSIWKSLGSSGFDGGIMHENSASVGSYTNTLLIDPAQTTNFSVKIRFYFRSYQGTTFINNSNGINTISGTATIMSGTNGAQHYTKVIVEEVFQ